MGLSDALSVQMTQWLTTKLNNVLIVAIRLSNSSISWQTPALVAITKHIPTSPLRNVDNAVLFVTNAALYSLEILQTLRLVVARIALDAQLMPHMWVKIEGVGFNAIALLTLISIEQCVSTAKVTNSLMQKHNSAKLVQQTVLLATLITLKLV